MFSNGYTFTRKLQKGRLQLVALVAGFILHKCIAHQRSLKLEFGLKCASKWELLIVPAAVTVNQLETYITLLQTERGRTLAYTVAN